jgi:hypothetical protein
MKWRIIFNMSLTGRKNTALRGRITKRLKQLDIRPIHHNAHSYEAGAVSPKEAAKQLEQIINDLADHGGNLDNVWIYIDRATNE